MVRFQLRLRAILSGLSLKENREIPPLVYERAWRLKRDFPRLTVVVNGGLRTVPETGQVVDLNFHPIPGLYTAGEMLGGLFYFNYPAGTGLVSGAVFGRIAGAAAAAAVRA